MLGKTESKRRRGWQRKRWLDSITYSTGMNLSKLWETVKNRGAWCTAMYGVSKSWTRVSNWTTIPPTKTNPSLWHLPQHNLLKVKVLNISCMNTFLFSWIQKHKSAKAGWFVSLFLIACVFFWKTKQAKTQCDRPTVKYFLLWTHPMTVKSGQTILVSTHRPHGDAVELPNSRSFWGRARDSASAWDHEG